MKQAGGTGKTVEFVYIKQREYLDEIRQLFSEYAGFLGIDLSFQGFSKELDELPGKYAPPDGALILTLVDGKAAGCIALRKLSEDVCEMKRLFVRKGYQGLGLGRELVRRILEEGRKKEYKYIRLDTLPSMKKAQNMYVSYGFYDIEPYVYNPIDGARYMELRLR